MRVQFWGCDKKQILSHESQIKRGGQLFCSFFPVSCEYADFCHYLLDGHYLYFEVCDMNTLQPIGFFILDTTRDVAIYEDGDRKQITATFVSENEPWNDECYLDVYDFTTGVILGQVHVGMSIIRQVDSLKTWWFWAKYQNGCCYSSYYLIDFCTICPFRIFVAYNSFSIHLFPMDISTLMDGVGDSEIANYCRSKLSHLTSMVLLQMSMIFWIYLTIMSIIWSKQRIHVSDCHLHRSRLFINLKRYRVTERITDDQIRLRRKHVSVGGLRKQLYTELACDAGYWKRY